MEPQLKVSRAITRLVLHHPFFGSLALSLRVEEDSNIPTACTNGKFIKWNPVFIDGLEQDEVTGLMAHEVCHVTFKHPLRRGERDPELWNIACDFAINDILLDGGFILPEGGLYDPQFKGLSAEAIYDRLPEDAKDKFGDGAAMGEVSDVTDGSDMSDAEIKQFEADIDSKIMMAAAGAKAVGKLPAAIKGLIKEMEQSQVDWRDVLRRFIGGDQPDDYTMRKPNKKLYHTAKIVAPSISKIGTGDIVLMVDTSGSVSANELKCFLGEMNAVSEDTHPNSVTVITFDGKVQSVKRYEQGDVIDNIVIGGRGGTMVGPAFKYMDENIDSVDNVIVFSDMGICDYPQDVPDRPVLWVSSWHLGDPAPFGETVYLKR